MGSKGPFVGMTPAFRRISGISLAHAGVSCITDPRFLLRFFPIPTTHATWNPLPIRQALRAHDPKIAGLSWSVDHGPEVRVNSAFAPLSLLPTPLVALSLLPSQIMVFCSSCGSQCSDSSAFCHSCGARLATGSAPPSSGRSSSVPVPPTWQTAGSPPFSTPPGKLSLGPPGLSTPYRLSLPPVPTPPLSPSANALFANGFPTPAFHALSSALFQALDQNVSVRPPLYSFCSSAERPLTEPSPPSPWTKAAQHGRVGGFKNRGVETPRSPPNPSLLPDTSTSDLLSVLLLPKSIPPPSCIAN